MDGVPALQPAIGEVIPDSYAAAAGLREGDRSSAVGDTEVLAWDSALVGILDKMVSENRDSADAGR